MNARLYFLVIIKAALQQWKQSIFIRKDVHF